MAGGLLSGKYTRKNPNPNDSRYTNPDAPVLVRRKTEAIWDVIEAIEPIATEKDIPMSQLAVAWVAQRPGVTSPIIGPRTMEQLEDNLLSTEVTFTEAELAKLDELSPPGSMVSPFYEADFGPHVYR